MVDLIGYHVTSFQIKNNAPPNTKLQLKNRLKYNVNYLKSKSICVGILELTIYDTESDKFEVTLHMNAQFNFDADAEKAEIHKRSFDLIFPVIRVMINTITAAMGMPGLILPVMHLDKGIIISTEPPKDDLQNEIDDSEIT